MAKNKNESNNEKQRHPAYRKRRHPVFCHGKVRIKVSEHFAQDGSRLTACWKMIQHAAAS